MTKSSFHMAQHNNMVWTSSGTAGDKIAIFDATTFEFLGSFDAHTSRILGIVSLSPLPFVFTSSLSDLSLWKGDSIADLNCIKTIPAVTTVTATLITYKETKYEEKLFCGHFDGTVLQYQPQNLTPEQELIIYENNNDTKKMPSSICGLGRYENLLFTVTKAEVKVWPNVQNLHAITQPKKLKRLLSCAIPI